MSTTAPPLLRSPPAHPAVHESAQDALAEQAHDQDAEDDGGNVDVQAHVAVEDVTELVGDDTLEFVARQLVEGAARDGDGRVGGVEAGGEGIEARLLVENVDRGHRDAGGDGHFLDDVEELAFAAGRWSGDSPAGRRPVRRPRRRPRAFATIYRARRGRPRPRCRRRPGRIFSDPTTRCGPVPGRRSSNAGRVSHSGRTS